MDRFKFFEHDPHGLQALQVISEAKRFNKWMYETISSLCRGKTLEIGSGLGNISRHFIENRREIIVSDIRKEYCNYLQERLGVPAEGIIPNLDLVDPDLDSKYNAHFETFDTVFALNVVEHIENDYLALVNAKKFLKPGGRLIILVPAYKCLYNTFDRELGHYRRYTQSSLKGLFLNAGYVIERSKYFNAIGIIGWALSGRLQKNRVIPRNQMRLYDRLVPMNKIIDRCLLNLAGLSVIVIGKKPAY